MRNAINILLICSCAVTAFGRDESRRDFQKTAALPAGRTFRLEHSLGRVVIRTHAKNEVLIHATIRCSASSANDAKSCADRIQISVQESASGVSVRTEYPRYEGRNNRSYSADYDITMPQNAPLDLRNRFGEVNVSGLGAGGTINNANGRVSFAQGKGAQRIENQFGNVEVLSNDGDVTVVTGNGGVTARDITGNLDISDRFGNIEVTSAGRNLTIHSANGTIEVLHVGGIARITNSFGGVTVNDAKADVIVRNENGEVNVSGVTGSAELSTTFGKVKFGRIGKSVTVHGSNAAVTGDTVGDTATVETTFGSVDVREVKGGARVTSGNSTIKLGNVGGTAYAKTSFGGVTIEGAGGPVMVVNTNGSVTVDARGAKCQPVQVETNFGPIRLTVAPTAGYNVSARTAFGRIHSDASVTVNDVTQDVLVGRIGSGGCELKLVNHNGNIDILSR